MAYVVGITRRSPSGDAGPLRHALTTPAFRSATRALCGVGPVRPASPTLLGEPAAGRGWLAIFDRDHPRACSICRSLTAERPASRTA